MEFCHAYVVSSWDTKHIRLIPRQSIDMLTGSDIMDLREVTIAYTPEVAAIAICKPIRDGETGQLDHFSRQRGRQIAGGRLEKLLKQPEVRIHHIVRPSLHDFPDEQMQTAITEYLHQKRENMLKIMARKAEATV